MKNTKQIIVGLGVSAAVAAYAQNNSNLFNFSFSGNSELMDETDYKFMEFITKHGKSY